MVFFFKKTNVITIRATLPDKITIYYMKKKVNEKRFSAHKSNSYI